MLKDVTKNYDNVKANPKAVRNILLVKAGDFYEAFDSHAEIISELLELAITRNREGREMCGFHFYMLGDCVTKMVEAGYLVSMYAHVNPKS